MTLYAKIGLLIAACFAGIQVCAQEQDEPDSGAWLNGYTAGRALAGYYENGDKEEFVREYKFKDPRDLALKAMNEIRNQLKLQLEIFQALFSLQAAQEFETTILEVIGEVAPDVRSEIIRRINQKRSVRAAVRFS